MQKYLETLWFKLTGKYLGNTLSVARHTQNRSKIVRKPPFQGSNIGGIELKNLGIEMHVGDLDERELHPHIFQDRSEDPNESIREGKNSDHKMYRDESALDNLSQTVRQPMPEITVGSIVTWGLVKTALLVVVMWFVVERFRLYEYWYVGLGIFWLIVAYPAFLQYQRFKAQTQHLEQNSLCATCCHFDETGHFCRLMDEHVSETYIPCEGLSWEGKEK
jgi:hypothetical protein